VLLSIADALAETIYAPEPIAETASFFSPEDEFSRSLRAQLDVFAANLSHHALPEVPKLVPWHLPHFEYDPERRTIFYPDVVGLSEEVLPFHATLYGTADISSAGDILRTAAPVLLPHEMFHFLRHQNGRLTEDRWHEEYVANRLAVAYAQRFCPDALTRALDDVKRVLVVNDYDHDAVHDILLRCKTPKSEACGYETDPVTAAVVHAKMVHELTASALDMETEFADLLGMTPSDAVAAE
jgi:hypothetical protein